MVHINTIDAVHIINFPAAFRQTKTCVLVADKVAITGNVICTITAETNVCVERDTVIVKHAGLFCNRFRIKKILPPTILRKIHLM